MKRRFYVALMLLAAPARAETVTLRVASVVPEGSAWARECRAFGRELAQESNGEVQIKWYFSGVAGDEMRVAERIRRDQLDGIVSGGMLCGHVSPSMRVLMLSDLFHDYDEASYVINRLKPTIDAEMARAGLYNLGEAGLGFTVLLARAPVHNLGDLKRQRFWLWDLDDVLATQLHDVFDLVLLPIEEAGRAYDQNQHDGFFAMPSAALAFQWSSQARYVINLRVGHLTGCVLMANRAMDQLSVEQRQLIVAAGGKLRARMEDLGRQQEELLLGGLFARQGLREVPVSNELRADFERAARAGEHRAQALLPRDTREQVARWLTDYRSQRRGEVAAP